MLSSVVDQVWVIEGLFLGHALFGVVLQQPLDEIDQFWAEM